MDTVGGNVDYTDNIPCGANHMGAKPLICVTSHDGTGEFAYSSNPGPSKFANVGKTTVDIAAPGEGIATLFPQTWHAKFGRKWNPCPEYGHKNPNYKADGNYLGCDVEYGYGYMQSSGTSVAAGIVASAAALSRSCNPRTMSPIKLYQKFKSSANTGSGLTDMVSSDGALNAGAFMVETLAMPVYMSAPSTQVGSVVIGR